MCSEHADLLLSMTKQKLCVCVCVCVCVCHVISSEGLAVFLARAIPVAVIAGPEGL